MEGGYYVETYRSNQIIPRAVLPDRYSSARSACTAIYFLLTPDVFSSMHRVKSDEIFHFYCGDSVDMLLLHPDGSHETVTIGPNVLAGEQPQVIVPHGVWQGARLKAGGEFALMGTTVAPGFDFEDYEHGDRAALIAAYPDCREIIVELTHG
jgi:predicted cupin superfamily sugar epimerase